MSLLLVLAVALAGADPLPEPAQKELKQLQGEWSLQQAERNGKKEDFKDKGLVLEIKDEKWVFTGQHKGNIIALDPKAEPRAIDLKSLEQGRFGDVDLAIYKLDGDTLTLCIREGKGKKRPTEFKSEDADTLLVVLKRVKK